MAPTVYVIYYSMYGHVYQLVQSAEKGLKEAGVEVKLFQVPETLPEEVLSKMHAPPKKDVPHVNVNDLPNADGFLLATPTRFGNWSAQFKQFWDSTGQLWMKRELQGKPFSLISSTASQGGGQESTFISALPNLIHHGMIFVPLGCPAELGNDIFGLDAVQGGSPFGVGTFAGADGSRQPTEMELKKAEVLGKQLGAVVKKQAA